MNRQDAKVAKDERQDHWDWESDACVVHSEAEG